MTEENLSSIEMTSKDKDKTAQDHRTEQGDKQIKQEKLEDKSQEQKKQGI